MPPQNNKHMMNRILVSICISTVLISTSCEKKAGKKEETKFQVTSPLKTDTMTTKEYVCQIRSIRHIELRALEKGYLQNYFVDEGKFVKKGSLMFQIVTIGH